LQNELLNKANELYAVNSWRFQQDNAPPHTADFTKDWLKKNVHSLLEHPPQSPDLNPIELIWAIMKKRQSEKFI